MFDELVKAFIKAKPVIDREGGIIPRFYIRFIAELEDYVTEVALKLISNVRSS